jgi:hypothetical protein
MGAVGLAVYWPPVEHRFPEIKARHTRTSLEVMGELYPAAEPRVVARLSPLVKQALDAALRLDYLPVMVNLEVVEAIRAELGPRGSRQVARESLRRTLTGPLLGGLVATAVTLFGRTPPGLLRWVGRGYGWVCRDCGEFRLVTAEAGRVELRLEDLPEELNVPSYLDAMAGALEAFLDVCRVDGSVTASPWPGGARFEVHWASRDG